MRAWTVRAGATAPQARRRHPYRFRARLHPVAEVIAFEDIAGRGEAGARKPEAAARGQGVRRPRGRRCTSGSTCSSGGQDARDVGLRAGQRGSSLTPPVSTQTIAAPVVR
ncbi:MAG: hypothetical protein IPI06_15485 [Gammaproteobacteria bacterium]|nr:hypothetical protein [Gammaproteobacteria bacterium]